MCFSSYKQAFNDKKEEHVMVSAQARAPFRGESEELEKRLDFLQLRRAQTSRHQSSATLSETQATWQSVAALARQECEKAQNENSRLKNELQMYSRASDKLQAHLTASESILDLKNDVRVGVVLSLRLHSNNSAVFGMLESRIYGRLHELNSIVREARYPADGGTTEVVQICRESGESSASAVELKHVRLLPFGEDTTSKNLWEIIELGGVVFKNDTRVAWSTPDTAGLVSCHSVPLGDKFDVTVDVHTVIKRFAMTTGMVALIESRSEWSIEYPTSLVARSTMSEKGWFMVHEYPKACTVSGGATQRASQLRTSVKIRPHEPRKSSSLTSTIVDVVIPSSSSIMSSYLQAIENFMLDSDHVVTRQ